jgi:hypothetical protein
MKHLITIFIISFTLNACQTLHSTTYIEPNKTFVLGDGNHAPFNAKVQNMGNDEVEVTITNGSNEKIYLGILAVGEVYTYTVPSNSTVSFKNTSESNKSTIKIKAKGDTNVSMGYQ